MSDNNSYFKKALSDFAFDAAYGDSIRHLYRKGYSPEAIKKHLNSESLSIERITQVIDRFNESIISDDFPGEKISTDPSSKISSEALRDTSTDLSNNTCRYEYVKEYDSYGRASFVRRKMSD